MINATEARFLQPDGFWTCGYLLRLRFRKVCPSSRDLEKSEAALGCITKQVSDRAAFETQLKGATLMTLKASKKLNLATLTT